MKSAILGLLAETPVHPGAGRGIGVVDLPVAREAATDYPVVFGSGLKGAIKDQARRRQLGDGDIKRYFGTSDEGAGDLLVSDARLLLLPVRSLTGGYRWATCPHLVERYRRDLQRAGIEPAPPVTAVDRGRVLSGGEGVLLLEEREFRVAGSVPVGLEEAVAPLVRHADTRARLAAQMTVLHDDDFAWFARYALSVQARNVLADGTKQSRNLWYEETLPPDTVLYSLVGERRNGGLDVLKQIFEATGADPYLQVGGNETVGQGWLVVTVRETA